MSIYIITTESFPNGMAATQRIRCYAKAISEKVNCQVIVVNRLEDRCNPLGNTEPYGFIGNYTYKYIGGTTHKPNNRFMSLLIKLFDVIRLLLYLFKYLSEDDRVIYYSYNITLFHLITFVIHAKKAKVYYELCEHPSVQCTKCPSIKGEDILWMKKNLSKCDGILVISTLLEKLVLDAFKGKMKSLKIPILFESFTEKKIIPDFNNCVPYIMHTGSLTQRKDGIVDSLTAFGMAVSKYNLNIEYILTGDINSSPDKNTILEVINKYNIHNNVKFVGYLSEKDMFIYQQNAYLTIINKEENLQNKYCFATKTCEYLNAKCLLVTTAVGEASNYLKHNENCLIFPPGDVESLAEIIYDIFYNKHKRESIAENGQLLAEKNFNCLIYSDTLIDFLK